MSQSRTELTAASEFPELDDLREAHYNATLVDCWPAAPGLGVFRVEPDEPLGRFSPGQYVPVGLGFWEPRCDGLDDGISAARQARVASRPYSISNPVVSRGQVSDPSAQRAVELYIALVAGVPGQRPPRLTPRLWMCRPGDRLQIGPGIVGNYTLDPVGPDDDVLFLATGTGEAPHNSMVAELALRGHRGRVAVLSTARNQADFAYEAKHRALEQLWSSYRYVPLATREPFDGVKRYIQHILVDRDPARWTGFDLNPERVHVFLCGNPAMVGRPEWDGDEPIFPEPIGALQILHQRGFTIDRKGVTGNVHFEAYW